MMTWSVELRGPRLVGGSGALARLPEEIRALGARRVLLVTDPGLDAAGWLTRTTRLLERDQLSVEVFRDVGPNPGDREVLEGAAFAAQVAPEILVALGGGSVLDATKGIALVHAGGGRVADYRGHGRARGRLLPAIGIPTTAGTGSEAQSYAVLTDSESGAKLACGDPQLMFRTVLLDPDLTASTPLGAATAATLDAITHAVESHVSRRANPMSRLASREAFRLLDRNAEAVLTQRADTAARGELQLGAFMAGRAIELAMLGAAHACANPLTRHFGVLHGIAVATMIPHVVRTNATVAARGYEDLDPAGPAALAGRLEGWLDLAGYARRLRDLGVPADALGLLATEAASQWTGTFNPLPLDAKGFETLYRAAW
jgi:alcohol dehydrogenase